MWRRPPHEPQEGDTMVTPASAETSDHDAKTHTLIQAIGKEIAKIDGVTELELVEHQPALAIWGFDYKGLPSSLMWNITP